ncbi:hypothetical protein BB560_003339 [Smittium megazygosporum]|uniref:Uncharacterized protein n=1 Tax=Smittium megazygosporum TaxID=133381 RepID=A0A2T9ZC97_9FUNG|nr:hypothetical protein BB560_003339 [Smittium megazygosporum]
MSHVRLKRSIENTDLMDYENTCKWDTAEFNCYLQCPDDEEKASAYAAISVNKETSCNNAKLFSKKTKTIENTDGHKTSNVELPQSQELEGNMLSGKLNKDSTGLQTKPNDLQYGGNNTDGNIKLPENNNKSKDSSTQVSSQHANVTEGLGQSSESSQGSKNASDKLESKISNVYKTDDDKKFKSITSSGNLFIKGNTTQRNIESSSGLRYKYQINLFGNICKHILCMAVMYLFRI